MLAFLGGKTSLPAKLQSRLSPRPLLLSDCVVGPLKGRNYRGGMNFRNNHLRRAGDKVSGIFGTKRAPLPDGGSKRGQNVQPVFGPLSSIRMQKEEEKSRWFVPDRKRLLFSPLQWLDYLCTVDSHGLGGLRRVVVISRKRL